MTLFVAAGRDSAPARVASVTGGHAVDDQALLLGAARPATAVAAGEVTTLEVTREQVAALLARRPALSLTLAHVLAESQLAAAGEAAGSTPAARAMSRLRLADAIAAQIRAAHGVRAAEPGTLAPASAHTRPLAPAPLAT